MIENHGNSPPAARCNQLCCFLNRLRSPGIVVLRPCSFSVTATSSSAFACASPRAIDRRPRFAEGQGNSPPRTARGASHESNLASQVWRLVRTLLGHRTPLDVLDNKQSFTNVNRKVNSHLCIIKPPSPA